MFLRNVGWFSTDYNTSHVYPMYVTVLTFMLTMDLGKSKWNFSNLHSLSIVIWKVTTVNLASPIWDSITLPTTCVPGQSGKERRRTAATAAASSQSGPDKKPLHFLLLPLPVYATLSLETPGCCMKNAQFLWDMQLDAPQLWGVYSVEGRSQCPRGLRHEMSSPAWKLASWVRIPLNTWMSVCVYSVFVSRQRPCDRLIPRPKSPTECLKLRNLSETKRFTDALCSKWEQQEWIEIFSNNTFIQQQDK
jgi:hypothetical protein